MTLLALWAQLGAAQVNPATIKSRLQGTILDARTKQPLAGAVLKIKGTTHAVSADQDGKFTFNTGQAFPYTLQVSYIGYIQQETVVNGTPVTPAP